nr:MAG TPA: Putative tail fiber protein fold, Tail fiber, receptor [Caudoviricetes sp.]
MVILYRLENLITLDKGDYFNANLGGLIIKVIGFSSKTGKNRYNFDKPFPNRCLICILVENDGLRNTEPALEAYDKNGFSSNNAIGTGAFYCLAIGY